MTRHALAIAFFITAACATASTPSNTSTTSSNTSTSTSTTTTVPVTVPTTTSPPVVVERAAPRRASAGRVGGGAGSDVWAALARCESGMRNLRRGRYSGYFSFLPSTWRSLGYGGMPADHSYEVQRAAAQRLVARSGWSQFPACSRKIGAR